MMKDEIVDQVRQMRERQAAKFNYDLKAIVADARQRQKDSGHQVVSFARKPKKLVGYRIARGCDEFHAATCTGAVAGRFGLGLPVPKCGV